MPDLEQSITFTVKELLQQVNTKLDNLLSLVHQKADLSDLNAIDKRVDMLERDGSPSMKRLENVQQQLSSRVDTIERTTISQESVSEYAANTKANDRSIRVIIIGLIFSGITSLATLVLVVTRIITGKP